MSGFNPSRYEEVKGWPVREALLAFVDALKKDALEDYRLRLLAYAVHGGKPPEIPKILKGANG